jgi:ABC-2 type transport system ATP-binding protein
MCALPISDPPVISISNLSKIYASGHRALSNVSLDIRRGEIFALLGPNGAGKTTLINIVCGIVNLNGGSVIAGGFDIVKQYRSARAKIGLVPQEITVHSFETVWDTVRFSRGLFGKPYNAAKIESVLKTLSLWDKKDSKLMTLSGGMKRRVMIAKALSHEPEILFLDEPSAGVDVKLRHDMWNTVRKLRDEGVTIILTTHYIEEAEEMADRIGVINKGALVLVEDKTTLIKRLAKRQLTVFLKEPISELPPRLAELVTLSADRTQLNYGFDLTEESGISEVLKRMGEYNIAFKNLQTSESSLEDIFVTLVEDRT